MKKLLTLALIIAVIFGLYSLLSRNPQNSAITDDQADVILFWGNGCPHCEDVKDYIKANQLDSKLKILQKEVYYNKNNQRLMEEKAKLCPEINPTEGLGVPFAWMDNKCVIGSQPIIDAINQKISTSQ